MSQASPPTTPRPDWSASWAASEPEIRSFGRKGGRALSQRQQDLLSGLLPRLRLDLTVPAPALATLFAVPVTETWLEIGFGGAEHMIWQATHHPSVGIIGCEPFVDGVVKALTAVDEQRLSNVRLHDNDARDCLRWLPAASIDRAFILFPDPWPKARHRKRRLVSGPTLELLARAMKPGAELRIGTDIADYAYTMLAAFAAQPAFVWTATGPVDWREQGADWPVTRYQRKAIREGRRCMFLRFRRA
jgi:tRNA (guanine-N7-)-methyltransferase